MVFCVISGAFMSLFSDPVEALVWPSGRVCRDLLRVFPAWQMVCMFFSVSALLYCAVILLI